MRTLRITPIPVLLIAFLFLLFPVLSYLSTADFYFLPFWDLIQVFSKMQPIQIIVFIISILVSIGILLRMKFGYYSFLVLAGLLILYNFWLIVSSILGYSFHVNGFPLTRHDILMNFSLTFFLLGSIYYFLNQEVSAPYFSPLPRGWRINPRETIPLDFKIKIQTYTFSGKTINLSSSGAMLPVVKSFEFEPGENVQMELQIEDQDGRDYLAIFQAILVRVDSLDYLPGERQIGIRFLTDTISSESKRQLSYFIKDRYVPRYLIQSEVRFGEENYEDHKNHLANISSNGLYINTKIIFPKGKNLFIRIPTLSGNIDLEGRVTWSNPNGEFGKERGFGVQISKNKNPLRFWTWLLKVRTQKLHTR
jgi:hypothetical protein